MKKLPYFAKATVGLFVALGILFAVACIWLPVTQAFRDVFGTALVVFIPGFVLSYAFFPTTLSIVEPIGAGEDSAELVRAGLDWLERVTLSFVLSLAVVPLAVYVTNRLGLPITQLSVVVLIATIICLGLGVIAWRARRNRGVRP